MSFTPNDGQYELVKRLSKWYDKPYKPVYVYSGGPGTGKTTIFKFFLDSIGVSNSEILACAYSGKAVDRMCENGLDAQTIHSTFYTPTLYKLKDEYGDYVIENGQYKYKLDFVLKDSLPEGIKLIVIDELSMVPDNIMEDILSFGIPIIGMGDIDQLPPIFGICSYMMRPDFFLTEIMRQDKDNPIIWICQQVKAGERLKCGTYGESRILRSIEMDRNLIDDYNMIIACRNKTRDMFNDVIRAGVLKRMPEPAIGDKVICRQNIKSFTGAGRFLSNGTVGYIDDILSETRTSKKVEIDFCPEYDMSQVFPNVEMDIKYIQMPYDERSEVGLTKYVKFEYGYAITAHLSQGSEYPSILYIDEPFGGFSLRKALRYTAISRASKKIDIVLNNDY